MSSTVARFSWRGARSGVRGGVWRDGVVALLAATIVSAAAGRAPQADPDAEAAFAEAAFAEMVAAYRAHPVLRCRTTASMRLEDGAAAGAGTPVPAELLYLGNRRGVLTLRGFTCWLDDGSMTAVHDSTKEKAYFRMDDSGSPYYALLTSFLDMPYPDLALAFGEDDPREVLMQLHPAAPLVEPVSVEDVVDDDGAAAQRLRFEGEGQVMTLLLDPETRLPRSLDLRLTSGPFVRDGTTLHYTNTFEYDVPEEEEVKEAMAFDPGLRQRVDLLGALVKAPPAPAGGGAAPGAAPGGGGGVAPAQALVGKPVPDLTLKTIDDAVVSLRKKEGRVVVLDFWATWCGPCRAALPRLHQIDRAMRDEELPVDIYTVNVWERAADEKERRELVRRFWTDAGHTLPILMDQENAAASAFSVRGIPTTVIVRSDGTVHAVHVGFDGDTVERDIRDALAALEAQ